MNHEHLPGMTQAEIDAALRAARSERYIISAAPADDAPAPWRRWIATALLVAAVLLGALLFSGCAAPAAGGDDGPRANVEMTDDGWACTNCAELIPIGPDDKPLLVEAEEGVEDAE